MQRILLICFFSLLLLFPSFSAPLNLSAEVSYDKVSLSWEKVENAYYYNIYINGELKVTIRDGSVAYDFDKLPQNTRMNFQVKALDADRRVIFAEETQVTTGAYEGRYVWVNPNKKEKKNKELVFETELAGLWEDGTPYMNIYSVIDGERYKLFPMLPQSEEGWPWIKYNDKGPVAEVYRKYCAIFNTSSIKPSAFQVTDIHIEQNNTYKASVDSKAFGMTVGTDITFEFDFDEIGPYLKFSLDGSSLVRSFLFKNPEGDDPYSFIFRKV